jgi:FAD/FMN-containing dehydrogenase
MGESHGLDRRDFLVGAGAVAIGGSFRRAPRRVPRTLAQAMRGHVFYPGKPGYLDAAHVYNMIYDYLRPQAVGRALDTRDVQSAVRWAVAKGVPLRARSGGHSYAGYSNLSNGVVIDLRQMNSIRVNRRARTATVGAGAQLIDVYAALARQGVTIPAGSCPSVGISGVSLGGGMGLAARAFGMSADNILGVTIVTADGRIRQVNSRSDPDLLWALRGGGGGNFGVVTQFTFKVHPVPRNVCYFNVSFPWSRASDAIAAWQAWAPRAPDQLTSIFHLSAGGGATVANANGQFMGTTGQVRGLLGPLLSVPGARITALVSKSYLDMQLLLAGCSTIGLNACHTVGTSPGGTLPRESFRAKSDYVTKPLSAAARNVLIQATQSRAAQPGSGALLFDSYGGAINRVAPHATAFVHRNTLFCIQYLTYDGGAGWLGQTHAAMGRYVSGQAYQNYIDRDLRHWQQAYYGSNYPRLVRTRRRVDPHHFFKFPQAI